MCVTHSIRPVDGPTLAGSNHAMSADKEFSYDAHNRRRSVDVGGLALALGAVSLGGEAPEMGKGWGGWEESELQDALYVHLPPSMRSGVSPNPHTMAFQIRRASEQHVHANTTRCQPACPAVSINHPSTLLLFYLYSSNLV